MTLDLFCETVGWIGSVMVLLAYGLLSFNKINSDSLFYQALNLLGSMGLIVITAYRGAFPSTFVNVVWMMIAVPSIVAILRHRRKIPPPPLS